VFNLIVRIGFVSNSSTSSFIIVNKTKEQLHIRDFLKENKEHIKKVLKEWDFYDIGFKGLDEYFMNDEFFNLKPGDTELEFSDDDSSGLDEKIDCLMHHALERPLESESFKSRLEKWHQY